METLPLAIERQIDDVCLRFEAAWQTGQEPRIDDFLDGIPEVHRPPLLQELHRLDAEYRQRQASLPCFPGYEMLEELGRGAMGVVFKARQLKANRPVAVKMILAGALASAEEVARFQREARAAAALDHPNIVPIYEVGEHEGRPFFTMKLIAGESLEAQVKRGPMASRAAAEILVQMARAIQHAHNANVIHRDLKPANVLLQENVARKDAIEDAKEDNKESLRPSFGPLRLGAQGLSLLPQITDFGLAKKLDEVGQTRTEAVMGTPGYMAPEQIGQAKEATPAVDVYGLGAVLYALLTGRPPHQAETLWDTLNQALNERPAPPRLLNPKIDRDLETICLKCLEKDPASRYQTAAALAHDLDYYLAGQPIAARPPSWVEHVMLQLKRDAFDDPAGYRAFALTCLFILVPMHTLIFILVSWHLWPNLVRALVVLNSLGIWAVYIGFYKRYGHSWSAVSRRQTLIWIGLTLGYLVTWIAAGSPGDASLFPVYSAWATLYGLTYFFMGTTTLGLALVIGMLWFLLALVIAWTPAWAPLEYAALYAINIGLLIVALRRRIQSLS